MNEFAPWKPPITPEQRVPMTSTQWYWCVAGVVALVPGVTILALVGWRAGGWRHPIRAVRGVWDDWHQAFFA